MLLHNALCDKKYSLVLIWLNMGANIATNRNWVREQVSFMNKAPHEFFTQLRPAARLQLKNSIDWRVKDTLLKKDIAIKNYHLAKVWVTMGANPYYGI